MTPGDSDIDAPEADTPEATETTARRPSHLIDQAPKGVTLQIAAAALRERIYGSIACLSTLLVITGGEPLDHPWEKLLDVLIATGGLWTASVLAEYMSHLGAHQQAPGLREIRHMLWVSGQIMVASAVPLALLLLAVVDLISLHAAVWVGVWVLIVEMGIIAFLAVHSTSLKWWAKLLLIAALVLLGLLVVLLKTLTH